MSQNEEGSETEWYCTWVPCTVYPREREREREGDKQKSTITTKKKKGKERICMHEKCMNM